MSSAATPKIFYQSSMPRAGSTLLQNILAQNPDFYVTPTSGLLELIFGARANYTNSPEFKAQEDVAMKKAFLAFSPLLRCDFDRDEPTKFQPRYRGCHNLVWSEHAQHLRQLDGPNASSHGFKDQFL